MKFSVCIATVRPNTLMTAIKSICRQSWSDWELIVVGQGKHTETREITEAVSRTDKRVRYLHLETFGLSCARNAGLQASNGDLIAMTDDDCEASEDWLATMYDYFSTQQAIGLVGGSLVKPKKMRPGFAICPASIPTEAIYDPSAFPNQPPSGWDWIGGNFSIRRRVAERVGSFDQYLGAGTNFPAGEDTDYKLRMEALGIQMASTPRAIVYHTNGYRYGLRAVMRNSKNYAIGNGALAAKLTLMGDPRGHAWLQQTRRECIRDGLKRGRPHLLPVGMLRLQHFTTSYNLCLQNYTVKAGILHPVSHS